MSAATIMVVEDESFIADDIRACLEQFGYRICAIVATGEEAVAQAKALTPNLALMDIRLRGAMDGITAASLITSQCGVPIVFLTSYADVEVLRRAAAVEPYGFLVKPFEERELRATIEVALFRHQAEKERERLAGELATANAQIKTLHGMLPICSYCKKIRNDKGGWDEVEVYLRAQSKAEFSHGMCPACYDREMKALDNMEGG